MGLFRRRRDDDDPLAGLRGDGTSPFGGVASSMSTVPVPAPLPRIESEASDQTVARIVARRETGVVVAGSPRTRLTIEVSEPGKGPSTFDTNVIIPAGSAAAVGDLVDLEFVDREPRVRLRPAIRPTR
jgi:hypothetical protein